MSEEKSEDIPVVIVLRYDNMMVLREDNTATNKGLSSITENLGTTGNVIDSIEVFSNGDSAAKYVQNFISEWANKLGPNAFKAEASIKDGYIKVIFNHGTVVTFLFIDTVLRK